MADDTEEATSSDTVELQLIGLFTLADTHSRALLDIECAAAELLGVAEEDDDPLGRRGHVGDAVYEIGDPVGRARMLRLRLRRAPADAER